MLKYGRYMFLMNIYADVLLSGNFIIYIQNIQGIIREVLFNSLLGLSTSCASVSEMKSSQPVVARGLSTVTQYLSASLSPDFMVT